MSPADRLAKWGRLLWGEWGWQSAMARALDIRLVTLQRWLSGAREPAPETIDRLETELRARAKKRIAELRAALR